MKILSNFPLKDITTFRLGGPAKFYVKVNYPEEALGALISAREQKMKYQIIAGGSNSVFSDQGFNGLVINFIKTKIQASDLEIKNNQIIVSAGLVWADLVKAVAKRGLAGVEKMAAIPGCVGGAVVGNAGAYGQEMKQVVEWVEIFDGEQVRRIKNKDCKFGYRDSAFKHNNWLVLRIALKLKLGEPKNLQKIVREISRQRWQKFGQHPICAGSFFKNPIINGTETFAAKLIEEAKLTNLKSGGISIAPWHHNFLINDGTGTTRDLLKLAQKIKKVVHQKLGIELEEEVRFIL